MGNRSLNTYQKINTIFLRDEKGIIMPEKGLVSPELEYLRNLQFECTEKIDGTNIRFEITHQIINQICVFNVTYKGKSDNAIIPPHLLNYLINTFPKEKVLNSLGLVESMTQDDLNLHNWSSFEAVPNFTIYGEGYGTKIQNAGKDYIKNGVDFIVFDVKVNDLYLKTEDYRIIANKLGANVVPDMGMKTIDEAISFVEKGFKSIIAENKDFDAEGLVLKTPFGLKDRLGNRIILKIKTCDFRKLENKIIKK